MLSLDDSRWQDLHQAYGSAAVVPALLRKLYSGPSESTWSEIWSHLCHQCTVDTATFAAAPHIACAARSRPVGARTDYVCFLGAVAAYEDDSCIFDEFREDYQAACSEAADMAIAELIAQPPTREDAIYLLMSLAGLCGCTGLGRTLDGFAVDEFPIECPGCGVQLYIWPSDGCYRIYAEDPVSYPSSSSSTVRPSDARIESLPITRETIRPENALHWIVGLSAQAGYPEIGERARQLFGQGVCPDCDATFSVQDEIVSQAV